MSSDLVTRKRGFFANLSLRLKTYFSFSALIAVLVLVAGTSLFTSRTVTHEFDDFAAAAELAATVEELEREMVDLRGRARAYFLSGDEREAELGLKVTEEAKQASIHAVEAAINPTVRGELETVQTEIDEVAHLFEEFVEKRQVMEVIVTQRLEVGGEQLIHDLDELRIGADRLGDREPSF